ncbi:hypothetical protein ACWD5B_25325, partial [Streptomyces tanashiensis]
PVFMRIEPQFVTVHELDYSGRQETATPAGQLAGSPAERPSGASAEALPEAPPTERHLHHAA